MSATGPTLDPKPSASGFVPPDERIAALEERIAAEEQAPAPLTPQAVARRRAGRRSRPQWIFAVGLVAGAALVLIVIGILVAARGPAQEPLGAAALSDSVSSAYPGAPYACTAIGGAFECVQETATGPVTLQVSLDYRGCWEAKPNSGADKDMVGRARACIGPAPDLVRTGA
jgi:hypothetical protein